jgi:hypothetical protein
MMRMTDLMIATAYGGPTPRLIGPPNGTVAKQAKLALAALVQSFVGRRGQDKSCSINPSICTHCLVFIIAAGN